ncbi:MAG TPA: MATE family efflux transporter, partial [Candidatus Gracilibacteria bacterium]|nr:MATE family efflux transporter [Candidatus Gracilibacteria bacterium]
TLVGQNMGGEKPRRAEKIANKSVGIGFITIIGISIIIFFAADFLAGAFLDSEPEVLAEAALFIRYLCFGFAFMATQLVLNGVYSGAGITRTSMIFSIVSTWLFEFPIAYIMSKHSGLGARGLWIAYPISSFLSALVSFIYFRMGRWKNVRIIPSKQEKLEHAVQEEAMIEEGL